MAIDEPAVVVLHERDHGSHFEVVGPFLNERLSEEYAEQFNQKYNPDSYATTAVLYLPTESTAVVSGAIVMPTEVEQEPEEEDEIDAMARSISEQGEEAGFSPEWVELATRYLMMRGEVDEDED